MSMSTHFENISYQGNPPRAWNEGTDEESRSPAKFREKSTMFRMFWTVWYFRERCDGKILTVRDSRFFPLVTKANPWVSIATPVRWTCSSIYLKCTTSGFLSAADQIYILTIRQGDISDMHSRHKTYVRRGSSSLPTTCSKYMQRPCLVS